MIKFTTILKEYSNAIIDKVTKRWEAEDSNVTKHLAKQLINLFDQKRDSLRSKLPILVLPDELRQNDKYLDITQYSYSDIVRLLNSIPENPKTIKKAAIEKFASKEQIDKPLAQSYVARFMNNREALKRGITNGIEDEDGNELFSKEQVIELIPKPLLKNNLYYDPNNWRWANFEQILDALFPSQAKSSEEEENTATTNADKIYDKDGIEIYKGDDRNKCISYNPIDPETKVKKYGWCVTQVIGSNMYDNYRFKETAPTFYFVFDRSKPSSGPKGRFDDPWHVFVIQVEKNGQNYWVTDANNRGDNPAKSWEDISKIVPPDTWNKIKGLKDYFKPIKLNAAERGRKFASGRNLSLDEFKELPQDEKILYIQGKGSEDKITDDILNVLPKYKINFEGVTKTLAELAIQSGQTFSYSQLKDNEKLAQRYAVFRFRHTNFGQQPIPLPFVKYLDEPAKEKYLETFNDYLTYEYIEKYFGPEITEKYVNDQLEKLEYLPSEALKYVKDPKKRQLFKAYSQLFSTWEMDNPRIANLSNEQLENLRNINTQVITPKPITEKEWKRMSDDDRSNILKVATQINGKEQYLTLLYALPYIIQDKSNMYVLVPKTLNIEDNWVLMDIKGNIIKDNINSANSTLVGETLDENNGYINISNFQRVYNISDLKINSSNNVSEEFRRMQQLAGIITEMPKIGNPLDQRKALGILFHYDKENNGYEWDVKALENLIKDMGYGDFEEVARERTYLTVPDEELEFFRQDESNPNLQIEDITIAMVKREIQKNFY